MLECLDEVSIVAHGLIIAFILVLHLLQQQLLLHEWIIKLRVGVAQFMLIDEQFKSTQISMYSCTTSQSRLACCDGTLRGDS